MKKRLMISIMMIALVAALVGGATFAMFTDTTTNDNNTFAAGTVDIATDPNPFITVANMAPGDEVTGNLTVKNSGSLDLQYQLRDVVFGDVLGPQLSIVKAETADGQNLLDLAVWSSIVSGGTEQVNITVKLNKDAGNEYQAQKGNMSMKFNAEQLANNPK